MAYQYGMKGLRSLASAITGLPRRNCTSATSGNNGRGARRLVTKSFTSTQLWSVPATTANLISLVGAGGTGTPGGAWEGDHTHYSITKYYENGVYRRQDSLTDVYSNSGHAPADYCDAMEPYDSIDTTHKQVCHYFFDNTTDATTGGSTTGFDKTFSGGTGGPATPVTYEHVPVTPGKPYQLTIPSGGSLTATFYE